MKYHARIRRLCAARCLPETNTYSDSGSVEIVEPALPMCRDGACVCCVLPIDCIAFGALLKPV